MMMGQFTSSEFCLRCRGCCTFGEKHSAWSPHLSGDDKKNLLNKGVSKKLITGDRISPVPACGREGFVCPFFNDKDSTCVLYDIRPFECRLYPFLINRTDDGVFLALDKNCPYIAGHMASAEFKKYAGYLTALFNTPELKTLLEENPRLIHAYNEVANLSPLLP